MEMLNQELLGVNKMELKSEDLLVKAREIVVPGQVLANGMDFLPSEGTYRDNNEIVSNKLGLVSIDNRVLKVISLTGAYIPKENDTVIGKIIDMGFSGWFVDIGSAYLASLSIRDVIDFIDKGADLTKYYDFNDVIVAKINKIVRFKNIDLTMKAPGLRKIKGGKIIEVIPTKVPRIIGKQGSMISMIKEYSKCDIIVGQNGKIWINGNDVKDELLATKAIMKIEESSHVDGLTNKIKELLEKESK